MAQVPVVENNYIGDGVTRAFSLTWPYLSALEVFVSVNGVNVPYAWLAGSASTVQTVTAPANGAKVRVYRDTRASAPLHKFDAGVPFLPRYVDENAEQLLYALQEGIGEFAAVGDNAAAALEGVQIAQAAAAQASQAATSASQASAAATLSASQAAARADRALRVSAAEGTIGELPAAAGRANKFLGFDGAGQPIVVNSPAGSATELEQRLAADNDSLKGDGMIGFGVGKRVSALRTAEACSLIPRPSGGTLNDLFNATEALGANIIPYTPPGVGTVGAPAIKPRSLQQKFAEIPTVLDYDTPANAMLIFPGRTVRDPTGIFYKNTAQQQLTAFGETLQPAWLASEVFRSYTSGDHPDVSRVAWAVELHPVGSGKNGPQSSDYCMNLSNVKSNWTGTTKGGEIDGLSIMLRQGGKFAGGVASDAAGILVNVGNVTGSGWLATYESVTQNYADDGTGNNILRSIQNAIGVLDSVTGNYHGFTTTANKGTLGSAFYADRIEGQGNWTNFLNYIAGGLNLFRVDGSGRIVMRDSGTTTPSKTIRVLGGALNILNDAQNANILTLSDVGSLNLLGNADISGSLIVRSPAANNGASTLTFGTEIASTASPGGGQATPATVLRYIRVNSNGTFGKIALYAD